MSRAWTVNWTDQPRGRSAPSPCPESVDKFLAVAESVLMEHEVLAEQVWTSDSLKKMYTRLLDKAYVQHEAERDEGHASNS